MKSTQIACELVCIAYKQSTCLFLLALLCTQIILLIGFEFSIIKKIIVIIVYHLRAFQLSVYNIV